MRMVNAPKHGKCFWLNFAALSPVEVPDSTAILENDGQAIVAETITITGTQLQDTKFNLNATIKSQQRYENGKIVRQEILSERSQLSASHPHS